MKAIVFDRDGVIFDPFDSPKIFHHEVSEFLSENDVACPSVEKLYSILAKSKNKFWISISGGRLRKKDFERWLKKYRFENMDKIIVNAKVFPWVEDTLEKLHSMGFKMALTSGWFGSKGTKELLEKNRLSKYFRSVLTLDDYIKLKKFDKEIPRKNSRAPFKRSPKKKAWLIRESLRVLDVRPIDAVFVGDAPEDVVAGKRLGTKTVAVFRLGRTL